MVDVFSADVYLHVLARRFEIGDHLVVSGGLFPKLRSFQISLCPQCPDSQSSYLSHRIGIKELVRSAVPQRVRFCHTVERRSCFTTPPLSLPRRVNPNAVIPFQNSVRSATRHRIREIDAEEHSAIMNVLIKCAILSGRSSPAIPNTDASNSRATHSK